MDIKVSLSVPDLIYNIYESAAENLEDYTVEDVMAAALQAYAQLLFEEMQESGELKTDSQ